MTSLWITFVTFESLLHQCSLCIYNHFIYLVFIRRYMKENPSTNRWIIGGFFFNCWSLEPSCLYILIIMIKHCCSIHVETYQRLIFLFDLVYLSNTNALNYQLVIPKGIIMNYFSNIIFFQIQALVYPIQLSSITSSIYYWWISMLFVFFVLFICFFLLLFCFVYVLFL